MSKNKDQNTEHVCECEPCECEPCECETCDCESKDQQIQELTDKLKRAQAELINYRHRKDEEVSRMLKYQGDDLIKNLLPIIDDFERAIQMDDDEVVDEVDRFLQGFKMMYANIGNIFKDHEIVVIDSLHQPFDPNFHQAVLTDKNPNYESGIITEVLAKGYMYKDKVLRPSMVKVNE